MLEDQRNRHCFPTCFSLEPRVGMGITARVGGSGGGGLRELTPLDMMAVPNLGGSSEPGMDPKKRTAVI